MHGQLVRVIVVGVHVAWGIVGGESHPCVGSSIIV